jgi:hypothetical protein
MLDLVPDIRGSYIVVESLWIILYHNLALAFTFIFPFDKLFLDVVVAEGLHKGAEFLLLVVSG